MSQVMDHGEALRGVKDEHKAALNAMREEHEAALAERDNNLTKAKRQHAVKQQTLKKQHTAKLGVKEATMVGRSICNPSSKPSFRPTQIMSPNFAYSSVTNENKVHP